jgi:hypothetical protein
MALPPTPVADGEEARKKIHHRETEEQRSKKPDAMRVYPSFSSHLTSSCLCASVVNLLACLHQIIARTADVQTLISDVAL